MLIAEKFLSHPQSVGENYTEHAVVAGDFGLRLLLAGGACLVHAVFPFLFERTGSRMIAELHQRLLARHSFKDGHRPLFEHPELANTTTAPREPPDSCASIVSHTHQDMPALGLISRSGGASR